MAVFSSLSEDDTPIGFVKPSCQFIDQGLKPICGQQQQQQQQQLEMQIRLDRPICVGCGFEIHQQFLLKVVDDLWHEHCLVCFRCNAPLAWETSCFIKDGRVYCRNDHRALFSVNCARCFQILLPSDFVYRCLNNIYHMHCFSCVYCGQHLHKGDQYLFIEGQLICRQDYELLLCNPAMTPGYYDLEESESNRKIPKRPRTILNSQQRRAFKSSFEKSAKPCRKVRETLANDTGLSVRVVQVWFQNQRAKIKKIQRKLEIHGGHDIRGLTDNEKTSKLSDSEQNKSDELKSPTDSLKTDESDTEIFDHGSNEDKHEEDDVNESKNPIEKLYNMQTTYFACI